MVIGAVCVLMMMEKILGFGRDESILLYLKRRPLPTFHAQGLRFSFLPSPARPSPNLRYTCISFSSIQPTAPSADHRGRLSRQGLRLMDDVDDMVTSHATPAFPLGRWVLAMPAHQKLSHSLSDMRIHASYSPRVSANLELIPA